MARIFHDGFMENLRRINTSTVRVPERAKASGNGDSDFARTLKEIQNPKENGGLANKMADTPPISNLSQFEKLIEKEIVGKTQSALPSAAISEKMPQTPSVGSNENSVKKLTPEFAKAEPQIPQVAKATHVAAPVILSAYRKDLELGSNTKDEIQNMITNSGRLHGVDPSLSLAVAAAESSFNPKAVSSDGKFSKGLFQLLDSTANDMMFNLGLDTEHYSPFEPSMNTHLGIGYLRRLHDLFSVDTELNGKIRTRAANSAEHLEKLAVAAYNTGEGNVARAQAKAAELGKDPGNFLSVEPHLPESTQAYVRRVNEFKIQFAGKLGQDYSG